MFAGRLLAIATASTRGAALQNGESATLVAGEGITGDRYANSSRESQRPGSPIEASNEVTLIEQEALETAASDYQLELSHLESRRNLLTEGVPLNHLVGRRFHVGAAILEGVELCEPCKHLERLTGKKVIKALLHRGGLRARIVQGSDIQVGDRIASEDR